MTAVLFSGQGSQFAGMAKDFYDSFDCAKQVFAAADEALGYRLEDIVFDEDPTELNKTVHSQPAIMACSLCALEVYKRQGGNFGAVAGHSLGEYAAMAASEMLSVYDAFRLIKLRAEAMQKAADNSDGVMCAVIGPAPAEVEAACKSAGGYVVPVNYNSPVQTVIAGEENAVAAAEEIIKTTSKAKRVKLVRLNVASAFHSEIMRPAADEFLAAAKDFVFAEPKCEFYSNVKGSRLADFSDMAALLSQHIVSPVRFTDELAAMSAAGFDRFVECGPGKVLTGLVKKTLPEAKAEKFELEKS